MSKFSKEDFTPENATRLMVIIMASMNKPPLTHFRDLQPTQKTKFNRLMNEYIADLGENWQERLLGDFNRIVNEDILNEEFDASKIFVRDTITERNVLLSTEQEEWIKQEEAEGRPVVY
jgi:hypothetical protein